MNALQWKFLRLRPASFPSLRIAQLASLSHRFPRLFSKLLYASSVKEIHLILGAQTSDYWKTHYRLGVKSKSRLKAIGKQQINSIILGELSAENNVIIRKFKQHGFTPVSEAHSQALLQLKESYRDVKKCLNCSVSKHWIN